MSYDESYFTARESWRDWRIEARWLVELARAKSGMCVLEIGCGGGGLLRMVRERGASAVGVDTLDKALYLSREQLAFRDRETRSKGDGEKKLSRSPHLPVSPALVQISEDTPLPFRAASFDTIIGQQVVEHLPDVDAALREWNRLLKPNGRIALATPNVRYPDPAHFADADHTHIFSPAELQHACEQAGFIVESCVTIFPFLSHLRGMITLGVIAHRLFQRAPYFSTRGRTIMIAARKF